MHYTIIWETSAKLTQKTGLGDMLRINFRLNNLNTMALFQFPTTFQCISLHSTDRLKMDVDNSERKG